MHSRLPQTCCGQILEIANTLFHSSGYITMKSHNAHLVPQIQVSPPPPPEYDDRVRVASLLHSSARTRFSAA